MTVAELLAREGMTHEFPAVQPAADDTPTDRIPVGDLLRREGKWDRRKAGRIGVLAAGVAALAGIAATALSAGQLHDTAAPAAGGAGGPSIGPSASQAGVPPQLVSTSTPTTSAAEPTATAPQRGSTTSESSGSRSSRTSPRSSSSDSSTSTGSTGSTGSTSSTGSTGSAGGSASAPAPQAPATTTTTAREEPPAAAKPAPTTTTTEPSQRGGVLNALTDTLGGVVGGLLGQ
ncbi:hypothetical protein [Amycolatopsis acidicola]|uniref:hypothetical protein n=1 Tax=Amycolatopsis acidicola TaxID=2596893 RepID=UPI001409C6B9|nr:hypothetical protein [Amycolatopsis acidicola]